MKSSETSDRFHSTRSARSTDAPGQPTPRITTVLSPLTQRAQNPGYYVGRIGALAVTLGVGAALAVGLGTAVAHADQQDSATSSTAHAKPSRSATKPAGNGRSLNTNAAPANRSSRSAGDAVTAQSAPNPASSFRRSASLISSAKVSVVEPNSSSNVASTTYPNATATPPQIPTVPTVTFPTVSIPAALPVVAAAASATTVSAATAPHPAASATTTEMATTQQPQAAATASAQRTSVAAMLKSAVASLSNAISGNTPAAADTSVALLLSASRRKADSPAPTASTRPTPSVEAEKMTVSPTGAGRVVSDRSASGRSALALVGSGTASTKMTIVASTALTIRAKTDSGPSTMTVSLDGVPITTVVVNSTSYTDYTFAGAIPAGKHIVSVSSSTATSSTPLYLDKVSTTTGVVGDEFSGKAGSAPDSTIWSTTTGTGWDIGIQNYVSSGVYLDGRGDVVIQATKTSTGGWTSGRIETANTLSLGYGTITARIMVPQGQGLWPAFWLMGADSATTGWPQAGEIDVMELPSTTTTMYSTLHGPIDGSTATQQAQVISNLPDLSTDFHDYWVTHLPSQITFGVDDTTLGTLTPADLAPGETWVYDRPMYAILNLAVGGSWAGAPDTTTPSTATMIVDSVLWAPPA